MPLDSKQKLEILSIAETAIVNAVRVWNDHKIDLVGHPVVLAEAAMQKRAAEIVPSRIPDHKLVEDGKEEVGSGMANV